MNSTRSLYKNKAFVLGDIKLNKIPDLGSGTEESPIKPLAFQFKVPKTDIVSGKIDLYHDLYFDRPGYGVDDVQPVLAMIRKGLKPGGLMIIIDHDAENAPGYKIMSKAIEFGCKTAIAISKKIEETIFLLTSITQVGSTNEN